MKHWSRQRKLSFVVHAAFVTVPFLASAISALIFWHDLFGGWRYAVPMVAVIDVLALTGLILSIARIPSPFVPLRHLLPVVSVVPLGRELYALLAHNGPATAGAVTAVVIVLFVWIAWQCFRTIEALFVSPVEAAREKARAQLDALAITIAALTETREAVNEYMIAWQPPRQLPRAAPATITPEVATISAPAPALSDDSMQAESKTARVKALAKERGVSESTAWRKVRRGEWSA